MKLTCLPCLLAYGLAAGSIGVHLAPKPILTGLDQGQKEIYMRIVNERAKIYTVSIFIGIALGALYLRNLKGTVTNAQVCTSALIALGVTYFLYMLWPKSSLMVEHLKEDQIKRWTHIYKTMQKRYHGSFVLGMAAFALMAKGVMC